MGLKHGVVKVGFEGLGSLCEHYLHVHPIPAAKPLFTLVAPSAMGDVAAALDLGRASPDSMKNPFMGPVGDTSLRRNFVDISSDGILCGDSEMVGGGRERRGAD